MSFMSNVRFCLKHSESRTKFGKKTHTGSDSIVLSSSHSPPKTQRHFISLTTYHACSIFGKPNYYLSSTYSLTHFKKKKKKKKKKRRRFIRTRWRQPVISRPTRGGKAGVAARCDVKQSGALMCLLQTNRTLLSAGQLAKPLAVLLRSRDVVKARLLVPHWSQ